MKKKKSVLKHIPYRTYLNTISILLFLVIALNLMYRTNRVFASTYAATAYPAFVKAAGLFCSIFPFSVFELLMVLCFLAFLSSVVRLLVLLIKHHSRESRFLFWNRLKKSLLNLCCIALSVSLAYSLTCGINYYRIPFSVCADLPASEYSKDDLKHLADTLIQEANILAAHINTNDQGVFVLNRNTTAVQATEAMEALSYDYPVLSDSYIKPKPVFFSKLMSYAGITGFYAPVTGEANYNKDVNDVEIPFVLCHELAHTSGFMLENEANFIAFMACEKSSSQNFKYSGILNVLVTVLNTVQSECGQDTYTALVKKMDPQIQRDLKAQNIYWSNYQSFITSVSEQVNNSYLKSNGSSDGIASYSQIVGLLITYYDRTPLK